MKEKKEKCQQEEMNEYQRVIFKGSSEGLWHYVNVHQLKM